MTARLGAVLLAAMAIAGCTPAATQPAPDPPAAIVEQPARRAWGDTIAGRIGGLASHIHNQLHERYGAPRERGMLGRDAAAVAGLRDWYRARLGPEWEPLTLSDMPGERVFGFVAGKRVLVVGWIDAMPDGRVPMLVMRYGPE